MFLPTATEFFSVFVQVLGTIALIVILGIPAIWLSWNMFAGVLFPFAYALGGRAVPNSVLWRYSRDLASWILSAAAFLGFFSFWLYLILTNVTHLFSHGFMATSIVENMGRLAIMSVYVAVNIYILATFGLGLLVRWYSWPRLTRDDSGQWAVHYGIQRRTTASAAECPSSPPPKGGVGDGRG